MENAKTHSCINCGASENEVPLIEIRFSGSTGHLCSQCIPVMIHEPSKMAHKLSEISKENK